MITCDVDALLDAPGTEIILCCGAGGVGKTTTAAALALRAAERGRHVAVLTVDPAGRLAQALGVDGSSGGEPRRVPGVEASAGGSLDALVLDAAGTLDALVDAALPAEGAASVKANPVYASVASSFAGTQEYMAMERLGQLRAAARAGTASWDLIVVDTPPSRSALDFLDAPERLARFLDGRFVRLLLAPTRLAGDRGDRRPGSRLFGAVAGRVSAGLASVMDRVLGARLLRDVEALVAGLDTVFGGFRARAAATSAALAADNTAFLVVAAAEPDPLAEAVYFIERLRQSQMSAAALVVNRATRPVPGVVLPVGAGVGAAGEAARSPAAAAVLDLHAELVRRAEAEQKLVDEALDRASTPDLPVAVAGAQDHEVADLDGLRAVARDLAGA